MESRRRVRPFGRNDDSVQASQTNFSPKQNQLFTPTPGNIQQHVLSKENQKDSPPPNFQSSSNRPLVSICLLLLLFFSLCRSNLVTASPSAEAKLKTSSASAADNRRRFPLDRHQQQQQIFDQMSGGGLQTPASALTPLLIQELYWLVNN